MVINDGILLFQNISQHRDEHILGKGSTGSRIFRGSLNHPQDCGEVETSPSSGISESKVVQRVGNDTGREPKQTSTTFTLRVQF